MRIVLAGATGFLGAPLTRALADDGHSVCVLSRSAPPAPGERYWQEERPAIRAVRWSGTDDVTGWAAVVDGADAVVNLAGESIAGRRWTDAQKRRLTQSRLQTTRGIGRAIHMARRPPRVWVNASAVGIYGVRGDDVLDEQSPTGHDFLARLAMQWEEEARVAGTAGTCVALLRTGVVLEKDGGVLGKLLPPFRLFAGGPVGSGEQYMSWIHRADWIALVRWLLDRSEAGPFNATAPAPVTNEEFSTALGQALGRPSLLRAPGFALRAALGEMAEALLLGGQRVVPRRVLAAGFTFAYPDLRSALSDILARR